MSTETLRPTSTASAANGTVVGAATVHQALADDSDATGVRAAALDHHWSVGFGTVSLPAGARVRWVRPWIRAIGNQAFVQYVRLSTFGEEVLTVGPGQNWFGFAERAAPPAGGLWSDALLSALRLGLRAPSSIGANPVLFAYEASIGVFYALAPAATAVRVLEAVADEVTTTSRPTAAWEHTPGADGGPQVRAEVRVFTDAQHDDEDFDPDVTEPVMAAEVAGSDTSVAFPELIGNGDYHLYVRTAQQVNGLHWSDWAGVPFTMDLPEPDPPTVGVTADDAHARLTITLTETDAADHLYLVRSTDGGTTWTPVRTSHPDGLVPTPGSSVTVHDYETSNGELVRYAARAANIIEELEVAGPWSAWTAPAAWSSPSWWLKHPHRPTLNMRIFPTSQEALERPIRETRYEPYGRPDPVIVQDVRSTVMGTLVLWTATKPERNALDALLAAGGTFLLQAPPAVDWGSRYVRFSTVRRRRPGDTGLAPDREEVLPFTEVAKPPGVIP